MFVSGMCFVREGEDIGLNIGCLITERRKLPLCRELGYEEACVASLSGSDGEVVGSKV